MLIQLAFCGSQVQMLSQQELLFAQEKGIPVIDIRPPDEFKAGHIKGYDLSFCVIICSINDCKEPLQMHSRVSISNGAGPHMSHSTGQSLAGMLGSSFDGQDLRSLACSMQVIPPSCQEFEQPLAHASKHIL